MAAGRTLLRSWPAALALAVSSVFVPVPSPGTPASCDWPMYGHDPGRSFAQSSDCADITKTNVSTLKPKWFFSTEDTVTASPSVVDGVVYVGSWDESFYAIDAETGIEKWRFAVDDEHRIGFGRVVSSAAIDTLRVAGEDVRVVLFGGGGTLYALDPETGELLATQDVDPRSAALKAHHAAQGRNPQIEILSSPVVGHFSGHDDRIFVGMDVHNAAEVGRTGILSFKLAKDDDGPEPYRFELLYKFDPETDRVLHSLTNPDNPLDPTEDTGFGCGGVWSSPVLDPDALVGEGIIVFGTSNCDNAVESDDAEEVGREGVFAIEAKDGNLLWKFRPRGPNHLDDDFGASPNLLPGGLVGEGGKDGVYYAFDLLAGTPAPLWPDGRSHVGQAGHVNEGFAIGGIIGSTAVGEVVSPLGGAEPAIFAATALSTPIGEPLDSPDPNPLSRVDASLAEDPGRMLSLHAISAIDGRVLWRSPLSRQAYGAPTYANHVLFVPNTFDFSVTAYDADTGVPLWKHPLNGSPSSAPAIVGDSIYLGAGTRDGSMPFLAPFSGVWAFELAESSLSPASGVLLNAQGNQLDAYDLAHPVPEASGTVIQSHTHSSTPPDDDGNDVNGQICRVTQDDGTIRYVMGEDSDQGSKPLGEAQGWGLFDPTQQNSAGTGWKMTDKLVPTYNFTDNTHLPDNTGCVVSADGDNLFTIDLGIGAFDVPGVGSLFMWFRDGHGDFSSDSPFCVLDDNLTTAGYIARQDDGSILVPESGRSGGGVISRFSPPFPSAGQCGYDLAARKSTFISGAENPLVFTPLAIVRRDSPLTGGKWLVGNVFPGVVAEFDAEGTFIRPVVELQGPGVAGMAVDAAGNLYIANLGLVPCEEILCPADGAGTLWKVSFAPLTDVPLPPIPFAAGLDFPEGMGIFPSILP